MKTVVLYTDSQSLPLAFVVEGDWSRFDGVVIGAEADDYTVQDDLANFMWDDLGCPRFELKSAASVLMQNPGVNVISIGFIP